MFCSRSLLVADPDHFVSQSKYVEWPQYDGCGTTEIDTIQQKQIITSKRRKKSAMKKRVYSNFFSESSFCGRGVGGSKFPHRPVNQNNHHNEPEFGCRGCLDGCSTVDWRGTAKTGAGLDRETLMIKRIIVDDDEKIRLSGKPGFSEKGI